MNTKRIYICLLVLLAIGERIWFDLGPNIELVTTASIMAGLLVGNRWRFLVPLVMMVVSDSILGIGVISMFTWSGFLAMPWIAAAIGHKFDRPLFAGSLSSLVTVFWFFVWTNFGVWLTDSYGMYANSFSGLIASYTAGIPFLRLQLWSALLGVTMALFGLRVIEQFSHLGSTFVTHNLIKKIKTS